VDKLSSHFLLKALSLAEIQRGSCAPNPAVGAVIVDECGNILSTGYHRGPGTCHAEVDALNQLKTPSTGKAIYVTLEPCCHWGRTPPCTEALIQAGIKRVVYGYTDPNPLVTGKGIKLLRAAGIECELFPLPEIGNFYQSYHYWHTTKKPFITAKIALSLDGKIAGKNGERRQITGKELNEFTHARRQKSDAILTTSRTIIHDNPQLNARYKNNITAKPLYILSRKLDLPLDAKIFSTAKSITIFHSHQVDKNQTAPFLAKNARCIAVNETTDGLCLEEVISVIGKDGIHDLWVEAGGACFSAFVEQKLAQRLLIYVAPIWIGEGISAFNKNFKLDLLPTHCILWQQVCNDAVCEIAY